MKISGEILHARLNCAVVSTTYSGEQSEHEWSDAIAGALNLWIGLLASWLEVLCGIDAREEEKQPHLTPWRVHTLPLAVDEAGRHRWFGGMTRGPVIVGIDGSTVLAEDWSVCVDLITRDCDVPVEARILADARAASRRRHYRRAVIDAATACEVALSARIRESFRSAGASEAAVTQALKNSTGIQHLYDLHALLGVVPSASRGEVLDVVARHRNDAAHGGRSPSAQETNRSIDVATRLVNDVSPVLNSVLDGRPIWPLNRAIK